MNLFTRQPAASRCKDYSEKFLHDFFSFWREKNGASGVLFQNGWRFSEKAWRFFQKAWRFFPGSLLKKFPKHPKKYKNVHSAPKFLVFYFSLSRLNVFIAAFYLF